eukprot:2505238-Prymnesium_polylepis.2
MPPSRRGAMRWVSSCWYRGSTGGRTSPARPNGPFESRKEVRNGGAAPMKAPAVPVKPVGGGT